ncbi:hypothetical protein ACE1SV_05520 [Streptomyces sp. E-15]
MVTVSGADPVGVLLPSVTVIVFWWRGPTATASVYIIDERPQSADRRGTPSAAVNAPPARRIPPATALVRGPAPSSCPPVAGTAGREPARGVRPTVPNGTASATPRPSAVPNRLPAWSAVPSGAASRARTAPLPPTKEGAHGGSSPVTG